MCPPFKDVRVTLSVNLECSLESNVLSTVLSRRLGARIVTSFVAADFSSRPSAVTIIIRITLCEYLQTDWHRADVLRVIFKDAYEKQ